MIRKPAMPFGPRMEGPCRRLGGAAQVWPPGRKAPVQTGRPAGGPFSWREARAGGRRIGSPRRDSDGYLRQSSSQYSAMVRSLENLPAPAMLLRHIFAKAVSSRVARMAFSFAAM